VYAFKHTLFESDMKASPIAFSLDGLTMVRSFRSNAHVLPHRVWNYVQAEGELADEEHNHILQCQRCLHVFILSLQCDTFGSVLKRLGYSEIENCRIA
jgi:hypothetical protein